MKEKKICFVEKYAFDENDGNSIGFIRNGGQKIFFSFFTLKKKKRNIYNSSFYTGTFLKNNIIFFCFFLFSSKLKMDEN
uniref:Uncharacterized protein n=1 Tax=Megaselia scalaris TaxID=36166 RepID=T1GIS3_MEGSC